MPEHRELREPEVQSVVSGKHRKRDREQVRGLPDEVRRGGRGQMVQDKKAMVGRLEFAQA